MKVLGVPRTIGELKELIKNFDDNTPFGFRNQPIQELVEDKFEEKTFVSFNEIETPKL